MTSEEEIAEAVASMMKLTANERRFVIAVLDRLAVRQAAGCGPELRQDTPERQTRMANHCQPFSEADRQAIVKYAELYPRLTTRQRQKVYREAAKMLGRSEESVKKAIRLARRKLEGRSAQ